MASPQLENYMSSGSFTALYQQEPGQRSRDAGPPKPCSNSPAARTSASRPARAAARPSPLNLVQGQHCPYKHTLMEAAFWTKIPYIERSHQPHAQLPRRRPQAARTREPPRRLGIQELQEHGHNAQRSPPSSPRTPSTQLLNHKKGNAVARRGRLRPCHLQRLPHRQCRRATQRPLPRLHCQHPPAPRTSPRPSSSLTRPSPKDSKPT